MKKVWVYAIFLLFAITSGGCATPGSYSAQPSSQIEKDLAVASSLRFDDVPIPSGFIPIPNESFIYQTDTLRAGVLRYTGKTSPESLMQFYKEQMPLYNWQLLNIIEFDKRQLNFEKPGQSCIVLIEGTRSKAKLTISIGPRSEKPKIIK